MLEAILLNYTKFSVINVIITTEAVHAAFTLAKYQAPIWFILILIRFIIWMLATCPQEKSENPTRIQFKQVANSD